MAENLKGLEEEFFQTVSKDESPEEIKRRAKQREAAMETGEIATSAYRKENTRAAKQQEKET